VRVLVIEGEQGAATDAVAQLEAEGHEVTRCVEPGAPAIPCKGMLEDRSCPLDEGPVDAALLVHDSEAPRLEGGEDGARCALRRHIPLVLRGDVRRSAYQDWAALVEGDDVPVAETLERARRAPLRRHASAARRSLRAVLEQHGVDSNGADAVVHRHGADLRVTLTAGVEVERAVAEIAAVRVVGAVRDVDPYPRVIDVTFEQS
jgi:hypothetical protein